MTQSSAEKAAEKRRHVRYALTGEIPGVLTNERGEALEVVAVDISQRGIGVLLVPGPERREVLTLTLRGPETLVLRFEVRWTTTEHDLEEIAELKEMRRCGLRLLTSGLDLLEVFSALDGMTIEE